MLVTTAGSVRKASTTMGVAHLGQERASTCRALRNRRAHDRWVRFRNSPGFEYGQEIGPSLAFSGNNYKRFSHKFIDIPHGIDDESGEFRNQTGYAGIRMTDGANVYYGWIQVSVSNFDNATIKPEFRSDLIVIFP